MFTTKDLRNTNNIMLKRVQRQEDDSYNKKCEDSIQVFDKPKFSEKSFNQVIKEEPVRKITRAKLGVRVW